MKGKAGVLAYFTVAGLALGASMGLAGCQKRAGGACEDRSRGPGSRPGRRADGLPGDGRGNRQKHLSLNTRGRKSTSAARAASRRSVPTRRNTSRSCRSWPNEKSWEHVDEEGSGRRSRASGVGSGDSGLCRALLRDRLVPDSPAHAWSGPMARRGRRDHTTVPCTPHSRRTAPPTAPSAE